MTRVAIINCFSRVRAGTRSAWCAKPHPRRTIFAGTLPLVFLVLLLGLAYAEPGAGKDQELFNQGKILIFDRNWDGARGIFQRVIQEFPQSSLVPQAYYFIARCYQFQSRESDAIRSYESFLQKYPNEPVLPSEARNAVVELAASMLEKGDSAYRDRLISALRDSQKQIRYFAAIRCSRLKDKQIGSLSVPILREIVKNESERDVVDRARIALLRLDPEALTPEKRPAPKKSQPSAGSETRMFHLEVYQQGAKLPKVELNLPMALADFAIKALDESTKKELRKQGFDIDNTWQSLKQLGPMKILTIRDGDNLVKLWID
jgi:hypothetical protein